MTIATKPGGVDDYFCVELDARGEVVALEYGSPEQIPDGLTALLRAAAGAAAGASEWFWVGDPSEPAVRVSLRPRAAGVLTPGLVVSGNHQYEFPAGLTRREMDVLTLVACARTNAEIAAALGTTRRTAEVHVNRVSGKLGASSRASAAVTARQEGILRLPLEGSVADIDSSVVRFVLGMDHVTPARTRAPAPRKRPLVVGAAFPQTGPGAADGEEMSRAATLAVHDLNARGGVGGREVAVEIVDIGILSPQGIRGSLLELANRGADVLATGYLAHQEVAHGVAAELGLPYLHATTLQAMVDQVKEEPDRYGNIFQACPSDSAYGPRFVEFATSARDSSTWVPSGGRLLILDGAWELTDFGAEDAVRVAESQGWTMDVLRVRDSSAAAWREAAEYVRQTEPAAVMVGHFLLEGAVAFVEEFVNDPSDTLLYLTFVPAAREFRRRLGDRAEGVIWATVSGTYSDALGGSFVAAYTARYGEPPGRSSAGIAYDQVRLLGEAWAHADNPLRADSVSTALRGVIHRGVNGSYSLGRGGQAATSFWGDRSDPSMSQAHLVFQVQQGQQRIVSPAIYADRRLMAAPWLRRTVASR